MADYKQALDHVEDILRRMQGSLYKFQKTANPDVFCSTLPNHWRSNKSLIQQFSVLILYPIPDGTKVTVSAGNEENPCADIKNNQADVQGQIARFSDLRFVGKSGRGKNFNLTITIHSKPMKEVAIVSGVIKVTVDGPRESRNSSKPLLDSRKRPHDGLHFIPPFLPLKQPRLFNPAGFPLLPPTVAPAHLQAALPGLQASLPPLGSLNPQMFSWAAIIESYKAAIMTHQQSSNQRLPNFMSADPLLMQQLSTMLGLKDFNSKFQADPQRPQKLNVGKKEERQSESPKLPSSVDLPSPCFTSKTSLKLEETTTSSSCTDDDSLLVLSKKKEKSHPKIHKPDLNSPNDTFSSLSSTATSSLHLRDYDGPIDVETTDDDDQHNEKESDSSNNQTKPIIRLWRPYSPPISTSPNSART